MPRRRGGGDEETDQGYEAPAGDEPMELADEDRLPWLEAVEEEQDEDGPSIAKLVATIFIGLVAIGLVVGGVFWLGNRGGPEGGRDGDLIAAPEGDYKVKPAEAGGMNVSGQGDTAYAASQGAQPRGNINANAVPEAPVSGPPAATAPAQPQRPAPAPAPGGPTIQLGAFSSAAGASRAWSGLSARFRYLAPLSHSVVSAQVGGRTVHRLRASGPGAADICRRLRIAGEDCASVD